TLAVSVNGVSLGQFAPNSRLVVFAQAGNDDVQVAGAIGLSALLYGGAGDDSLKGGGGNDILMGGEGNDPLVGGDGRDILIGGVGADRLVGNADDDILIAGYTAYDSDAAALDAVLRTWARTDLTYAARVNALRTGPVALTDATVRDDGAADLLTGSAG